MPFPSRFLWQLYFNCGSLDVILEHKRPRGSKEGSKMATLADKPALDFTHIAHPAPVPAAARNQAISDPGFGTVFTDNMVAIDWKAGHGWHNALLMPRGPLTLDPAAAVLHYAQEIFEGLKAYKLADGTMALFRPDANARRFNKSAARLAMPGIPEDAFVESVRQLVAADREWFP